MTTVRAVQRIWWKLGIVFMAAALGTTVAHAKTGNGVSGSIVFYDTSGGSVLAGYQAGLFPNFTKETGVTITDDYNDADFKFFAAVEAGHVPWSVVAFNTVADGLRAAEKGYLLPLDESVVPVSKMEPGAYGKYGIRAVVYGMVLAWNTKKWPLSGKHPTSWKDFYDVKAFPGTRCLYKGPQSGWVLESALLADGVSPEKLYPLDVKRAFKKLDALKGHVVWWSSGSQSVQYMATEECDMGIMWSGRALAAVNQDHLPLGISWDGAGYTSDLLAVPKDAPNAKAGFAFLAHWINDREGQIKFVDLTGYPTHIKGLPLSAYNSAIQEFLPAGTNMKHAVQEDDAYYLKNLATVNTEFTQWLAGF